MKSVNLKYVGFFLLGAFLCRPDFFLSSVSKSLVHSKLELSSELNSAFNDDSLHAGIGGTWSGADKGGAGGGHSK